MQIKTSRKSGFTLVEIMIVVAIIGLLAAIAIPNFVKARTTAQTNTCIANLKQIQGAIQQWALEEKKPAGAAVALTDISGDATKQLKGVINTDINCPAGGTYAVTTVDTLPTCSIGGTHVIAQ
ncbi:MAG: prepilin-type N-terminal cleavage/methylation domain-containing protein [Candidatus Omnitrophica bacterium]|nr:prepilin-type N-terminal cleavage/methylation domain-containing protein [Candidatus Omnitrophota bacterium]